MKFSLCFFSCFPLLFRPNIFFFVTLLNLGSKIAVFSQINKRQRQRRKKSSTTQARDGRIYLLTVLLLTINGNAIPKTKNLVSFVKALTKIPRLLPGPDEVQANLLLQKTRLDKETTVECLSLTRPLNFVRTCSNKFLCLL